MRRCYPIIALFLFCSGAAAQASDSKPTIVFYRNLDCPRCDTFECVTLRHPIILRRLPRVNYRTEFTTARPSVAWFDASGDLRQEWPIVPDTINA